MSARRRVASAVRALLREATHTPRVKSCAVRPGLYPGGPISDFIY